MDDIATDEVSWLVVCLTALVVFVVHVLLIMAPQLMFRVHKPSVRQARVLSVCNCLAGGVFLAASLLGSRLICGKRVFELMYSRFSLFLPLSSTFHKIGLLPHAQSLERASFEYVLCVACTHFPD
jgi:hypothetical protein